MSLREDLEQLSKDYFQQKADRARERQELKAARAEEDEALGRKHALEDLEDIVANIKQAAFNGVQEYEFEIDQSYELGTSPYGQGYFDALKAFMQDHNVGMHSTSYRPEGNRVTSHKIFIYWR